MILRVLPGGLRISRTWGGDEGFSLDMEIKSRIAGSGGLKASQLAITLMISALIFIFPRELLFVGSWSYSLSGAWQAAAVILLLSVMAGAVLGTPAYVSVMLVIAFQGTALLRLLLLACPSNISPELAFDPVLSVVFQVLCVVLLRFLLNKWRELALVEGCTLMAVAPIAASVLSG